MWLLSNEEAFNGRRLWLRPGKTYLFGRTAAEPGQLAISHNTISRKHLTITVGDVEEGGAHKPSSRSKLTIEDLATKIGTVVNGQKIKGSKYVVEGETAEMTMGKCPHKFRITWSPVVFSFSFTKKELQKEPVTALRERFEQLDMKVVTDYSKMTTHVVSKKRNTAKGLQALINGKYIVNETFLDAVIQAASPPEGGDIPGPSPLEQDFDQNWPDAKQHLPPRGGEPVQHPDAIYNPDPERAGVFEGYTFIFYDKAQFDNLLAPITGGGGKALLGDVDPRETQVDEFVRYVKNVAGEKGLGAFDDGSEGKGVVLVRYLPSKGALVQWYAEFLTAVSLRLDHRPIEQSEFLEAILIRDASILRRPLEVESQNTDEPQHAATGARQDSSSQTVAANNAETPASVPEAVEESQPPPRRGRTRRPVKRRFAGFDDDADIDMDEPPPASVPASNPPPEEEGGLFVSQEQDAPMSHEESHNTRASQKRRHASPLPEDDLMSGMAPAAAKFKRQRLERGEDLNPPTPEPEASAETSQPGPKKKIKKEFDILAMAAQNREEEEARARAEKEDLANLPDDVDLSEIRRLHIVEEMEVRAPATQSRTREQDIADGRWDPKWNGTKNFKKFRRRGQVTGRAPARVIVPLTEVKIKEFGVGDDYWLEDEDSQRKKKTQSQASGLESQPSAPPPSRPSTRRAANTVQDSSDEELEETPAPSRTRTTRTTASQSQSNTRSQTNRTTSQGSKRAAPEPAKEQPAKRRPTRRAFEIADSDDSDDELKFRFGKRR
ncbi:Fc.00g022960.m01.CDS01 [Cosmosporella sp. VM-42]